MRTRKIALNTFKTFICNQTYLNLPRKVQVGDGVASTQATSSGVAGVLGTLQWHTLVASFWAADSASWP